MAARAPENLPESDCFSYLMPDDTGASSSSLDCAALPRAAVLGRGQYGVVWRARSRTTGGVYAIKSVDLARGLEDEQGRQETKVAETIRDEPHPCLVRLFQVHPLDNGALCTLVMELCRGGDLHGQIRRARQRALDVAREAKAPKAAYVPPEMSRIWVSQVFMGLVHLHLKVKVLMRDLKPGNVLICDSGCAKLTDFGLSRVGVVATGKSFGFQVGTAGYIAPEVGGDDGYDQTADLYSLGVLIWVLLTGGGSEGGDELEDDDCEPRPPSDGGATEECELLERRLCELKEEAARALVQRLTHMDRQQRLDHGHVREDAFFASPPLPRPLPPLDADAQAVEAWVQDTLEAHRKRLLETVGDSAMKLEDFLATSMDTSVCGSVVTQEESDGARQLLHHGYSVAVVPAEA
eukprot:SRR837773.14124.p1 GENE.SRR837773.14124~~SRR837773.14124.p1  ORF type:complete len:407 (+),score=148.33 SRR837773.14124:351-1571(+)